MILPILKHLEELRKQAVEQNRKTHELFRKYESYYKGESVNKDVKNQLNVIKGIIDTKTTLVLDFDPVSSVVPKTKSFANIEQVGILNDVASVLDDCNKNILKVNNFDTIKQEAVKNFHIFGKGITKTIWSQKDEEDMGEVKIECVSPLNFYPDTSAKKIQDCNFIFEREVFSSMTLKKEYPQFAEKFEKAKGADKERDKEGKNQKETGVITVANQSNVAQIYTDGDNGTNSISQAKNIVVWNCWLKDDSTFIDTKDEEKQILGFLYPNGRYLRFVENAEDYLLEDKEIDYPFGYPFDVIEDESSVKFLTELQDRINAGFRRIQQLVGGYLSLIGYTPESGLSPQDLVDQLTVELEMLGQTEVITNNTLDRLKSMLEYVAELKEQMYEIARINPQLISGKKPDGVKSGRMVEILNESPMTAINEVQKFVKNFILSQGKKNIVLIQLYYNIPRIVRLVGGDLAYIYPAQENRETGENIPPLMRIYRENAEKEFNIIKEIKADLSIGEYDIDVVAGTQMPRSRAEKANIYIELAKMGKIPENKTGTMLLLDALDIPDKTAIKEAIEEQEEINAQNTPPINIDPELAGKIFKDMPLEAQVEYLKIFGFKCESRV